MEIQKAKLGTYDKQYTPIVRTETPTSVKPNILRDLEDPVVKALILSDKVLLSPEAKKLLKKLANNDLKETINNSEELLSEQEWLELYSALQEFAATNAETAALSSNTKFELVSLKQRPLIEDSIEGPRPKKAPKQSLNSTEELLDKMIVSAPSLHAKTAVIKELTVFGEELIKECKHFGVRIIILPREKHLGELKIGGTTLIGHGERTFDGRPWETVRGIYDTGRRLIALGEELIGLSHSVSSRHEFAHAYDHMYTTKYNRKLPLSVQLWNLFAKDRKNFISEYAATKPSEYFAETVEAFLNPRKNSRLIQCDPSMATFLTKLLTV